jgi:O-antigen/teichoic acid export membrane protein
MITGLKTYYTKITPNIFWGIASKGVAAIAFILIDILLGRVLETELYGRWSQFFSLLTILLYIAYSGVPAAAQSFAAQNRELPELKNVLRNSLVLQIGFSIIATGLLLLLRNQITEIINHPDFAIILLYAAPYLLIGALEEYLKNIFIGVKRTLYHFYMNVLSFGLRLIFLILITIFFRDYFYTANIILK